MKECLEAYLQHLPKKVLSPKNTDDLGELVDLLRAYDSPGPALRHLQGQLVTLRASLERQILRGDRDDYGVDQTPLLRQQLLVVEFLLAVPELLREQLGIAEESMGISGDDSAAPTLPLGEDWPDLN